MSRMTFHISDGGKGGVGKSTTAVALINYLSGLGGNILVIETDTQNPDVIRCTRKSTRNLTGLYADLRSEDGWNDLLETIEKFSEQIDHAVMSLPGADLNIGKYVPLTQHVLKEMGVALNHYFTINRQPDSLALLSKSVESGFSSIADGRIVVLNGVHGDRAKFDRFDESKARKQAKAKEIFLPELYWKTVDEFAVAEMTFDEFADAATSPLLKSRVKQWVAAVNGEFSKCLED